MKLLLLTACLAFGICFSASAQHSHNNEVLVLDESDSVPPGAKYVDDIKVRGGTFREAGYLETIHKAKEKALRDDCNVVKITELDYPDSWNGSFKLYGQIYHLDNIDALLDKKARQKDSVLNSLVPPNADYAVLYVYRPRSGSGALVQYNLHANDSEMCRIKAGGRYKIRLSPGETTLWARTEARKEVYLDVKPGKAYFLKCFVKMGVFVGEPDFNIVDTYQGYMEFMYGNFNDNIEER